MLGRVGENGAVAGDVGVVQRDARAHAPSVPSADGTALARPNGNGTRGAPARPPTTLTYVPGLDGLRGISVLAVLAWHFRPDRSLLRGGYLGVEVFFVISGYLITSLLLAERRRHGRIRLASFWARRIRRLWPALFAMLLITGLVVAVFYHEELGRLKGDLFFGFYAENWWHIFHGVSYFAQDTAAPLREPFQHLWSLAVEEQFYLIWPIELAVGLFLLGRRNFRYVILAQAALGYALMVWLAAHGSTNHAYLGTETRMTGLLLGCLLAFSWSPYRLRGPAAPNAGRVLDGAAAAALALLAVLFFTLRFSNTGLYYWGFLVVDAATIVLIAAIMHPSSRANRVLGWRPLRAVGLRSYGLYLWGIVVFEFTRPGIDWDPPSWLLWTVRIGLVVVITEASYRLLETPIRRGALTRAWRDLRTAHGERQHRLQMRWEVGVAVLALAVAGLSTAAVAATDSTNCQITNCLKQQGGGNDVASGATIPAAPPTTLGTLPVESTTTPAGGSRSTTPTSHPTTTGFKLPNVQSQGWAVTAVGDSVMLGASQQLAAVLSPALGPVYVNAQVSRGDLVCVDVLRAIAAQGKLGPVVLVHCGDNGVLAPNFVDLVMQTAGPVRHVVFYNLREPRGWEPTNNNMLVAQAGKYPNARVIDWHYYGNHLADAYFYSDGIHLTPPGREYYAQLTLQQLQAWHWAP
jgi:peptidoglycan/LPS O-acetylase OafA/YrhL